MSVAHNWVKAANEQTIQFKFTSLAELILLNSLSLGFVYI